MPLRMLTRLEYQNTIRDLQLVSNVADATRDLPPEGRGALGTADGLAAGSSLEVDRFLTVAEAIAKSATATASARTRLLGCDPAAAGEDPCARQLVTGLGRRAFRRPLATEEIDALVGYYKQVRADLKYDFAEAVRVLLEAILQSPEFLYRWELGPQAPQQAPLKDGALVKLGAHEVAARLSYFLWSSMPDATLFAKADADALQTPAQIEAEARRLIADKKAADAITRFHDLWLDLADLTSLQKDPKILPPATARAVLDGMRNEARAFITHVFNEAGGRLETMLAAPYSFLNEALAKHYGVPDVVGSAMRKVDLDPAQRAGILTHGAFLSIHGVANGTSPVRRGKTLLLNFLCDPPAPPPDGLNVTPPVPDPNLQTREQFTSHSGNPACRACHLGMDNLGFAFEAYDTVARYRTTEAGRPVNAAATIPNLDGGDRGVGGATDLAKLLSKSPQVRQCVMRQWMRFALGRIEVAEEAGSLRAAFEAFAAAGYDLRALLVALTTTKAFLYRKPFSWEVP